MYLLIFISLVTISFSTAISDLDYLLKLCNLKRNPVSLLNNHKTGMHTVGLPFPRHFWMLFYPQPFYASLEVLNLNILVNRNKRKKPQTQGSHKEQSGSKVATTTTATTTTTKAQPPNTDDIDFLSYHSLSKIYKYLSNLPWKYPNLAVVPTIGRSFEGRDIKLVKVSTGEVGAKAAILIIGGMQANQWFSSAAVLYTIQQLVENPVNNYLLGKADWYLLPVANPDGYVHSFNTNRRWTKTRSHKSGPNGCVGVNLNKNFDYQCHFNQSYNSCDDLYAGSEAFSENEAKALRDFLNANTVRIQLYINVDGYGQSIEFPMDSTKRFVQDSSDLKFLAERVSYAINKHGGRKYAVKSLDRSDSCGSEQWIRRMGIKYSYKFKLPTQLVPEWESVPHSKILALAQELFVGLRELQRTAVAFYGVAYDLITDD